MLKQDTRMCLTYTSSIPLSYTLPELVVLQILILSPNTIVKESTLDSPV